MGMLFSHATKPCFRQKITWNIINDILWHNITIINLKFSLSAHIVKMFIFPSNPIFHAITFGKNIFDLDKKRFFNKVLKTWKPYIIAVYPCRWSHHRHTQSYDVDSGTCEFGLDLSRLFYLCKFSFVFHAECSFPPLCMNFWV